MSQIKSLFVFLFMLVVTLFTASDVQAFALGNHAGGFFSGRSIAPGSITLVPAIHAEKPAG